MASGSKVGALFTAAGIPVWAIGLKRKTRADLSLLKFNTAAEHSTTFGAGITIMFGHFPHKNLLLFPGNPGHYPV